MSGETVIHPSADISDKARIGPGTVIWQHCVIVGNAVIGTECKLAHNTFVEGGVSVGNRVTIKDNVALYDGVTVEDDVFIGPNAVFTNVLRPRAFLSQKDSFAATVIRSGATIGANATIICGVEIGAYAMIGAGSVVSRNVPAHALVVGKPARRKGWVSRVGATLSADGICEATGERYVINPDSVRPAEPDAS